MDRWNSLAADRLIRQGPALVHPSIDNLNQNETSGLVDIIQHTIFGGATLKLEAAPSKDEDLITAMYIMQYFHHLWGEVVTIHRVEQTPPFDINCKNTSIPLRDLLFSLGWHAVTEPDSMITQIPALKNKIHQYVAENFERDPHDIAVELTNALHEALPRFHPSFHRRHSLKLRDYAQTLSFICLQIQLHMTIQFVKSWGA